MRPASEEGKKRSSMRDGGDGGRVVRHVYKSICDCMCCCVCFRESDCVPACLSVGLSIFLEIHYVIGSLQNKETYFMNINVFMCQMLIPLVLKIVSGIADK